VALKTTAAREIQAAQSQLALAHAELKKQKEATESLQRELSETKNGHAKALRGKEEEIKKLRIFLKLASSRIEIERRSIPSC